MTMNKTNSPYTAAITGCAFLFGEFMRILPLLMAEDCNRLLKEEIENNVILKVNSRKARQTFVHEFRRRYDALPYSFWQDYQGWSETARRAGLFYAILKTYKLVFDFHFNVTIKCFNSALRTVTKSDLMMEFCDISARDSFVESWTDNTKDRCASQYLTILRQAGLMEGKEGELHPIKLTDDEWAYYLHLGEDWFLEACLLLPYEINDLKQRLQ